jgi:hypothetical protein
MGLDIYLMRSKNFAKTRASYIKFPSQRYPEHFFKVGHFYSSNNDSGINRVLSDSIGLDLHSIFNPLDEDYFQPDWNLALNICSKAIRDFTRISSRIPIV